MFQYYKQFKVGRYFGLTKAGRATASKQSGQDNYLQAKVMVNHGLYQGGCPIASVID